MVKTKTIRFFGSDWNYEKYGDDTWSLETNDGDVEVEMEGRKKHRYERSLNLDLGINSWVNDASAPKVKPWVSWNVGVNYQHQYHLGANFSLNPSLGVSWYNFKLEDSHLMAVKNADGIVFEDFENGEGTKSKISASYLNVGLIPIFHSSNGEIRFGLGPYAGLRMGGRGKFVYKDESGRSQKLFEKSNMYANNFRYGGRLLLGISKLDFYVNYDLNGFFQKGKGPDTNAISFGLIL